MGPTKRFELSGHQHIELRIIQEQGQSYSNEDLATGLHNFARDFVNPYFQALLSYFNNHVLTDATHRHRQFHSGQLKPLARIMTKATELHQKTGLPVKKALLSTTDIVRSTFTFQLPS